MKTKRDENGEPISGHDIYGERISNENHSHWREKTYRIIRFHFSGIQANMIGGLSLEEAKEHCKDIESSSSTCETEHNLEYTKEFGEWFDGFTEEN